jgi:hypothetical protein
LLAPEGVTNVVSTIVGIPIVLIVFAWALWFYFLILIGVLRESLGLFFRIYLNTLEFFRLDLYPMVGGRKRDREADTRSVP